MAKAWDIEPSIFAGMIEEDVGLKIRYIAIQILTAIVDWPPESPDNQYHLNK
ncbi:hypothetical protein [Escherichia coli]|uniref:hypothetical protein n=1 Tax=Escherichia coli TaxID=562 RepID=UPI0020235CD6|nr:hypothetical protein [Escherichia coli]